nr:hypothetical transcript [Hymenolepis microstoma]
MTLHETPGSAHRASVIPSAKCTMTDHLVPPGDKTVQEGELVFEGTNSIIIGVNSTSVTIRFGADGRDGNVRQDRSFLICGLIRSLEITSFSSVNMNRLEHFFVKSILMPKS